MSILKISIDDTVIIQVDVDKVIGNLKVLTKLARSAEYAALIKGATSAIPPVDSFDRYVDAFCSQNGFSRELLFSRKRTKPLPQMRILLAVAWHEVSHEIVSVVAKRMGLSHSTIFTQMKALEIQEHHDSNLLKIHENAVKICKTILGKQN